MATKAKKRQTLTRHLDETLAASAKYHKQRIADVKKELRATRLALNEWLAKVEASL